jgi:hypothetical protein
VYARSVNLTHIPGAPDIFGTDRRPSATALGAALSPPADMKYRYAALPQAVTMAPAGALSAGRRIARDRILPDAAALASAQVTVGAPKVAPSARSTARAQVVFTPWSRQGGFERPSLQRVAVPPPMQQTASTRFLQSNPSGAFPERREPPGLRPMSEASRAIPNPPVPPGWSSAPAGPGLRSVPASPGPIVSRGRPVFSAHAAPPGAVAPPPYVTHQSAPPAPGPAPGGFMPSPHGPPLGGAPPHAAGESHPGHGEGHR